MCLLFGNGDVGKPGETAGHAPYGSRVTGNGRSRLLLAEDIDHAGPCLPGILAGILPKLLQRVAVDVGRGVEGQRVKFAHQPAHVAHGTGEVPHMLLRFGDCGGLDAGGVHRGKRTRATAAERPVLSRSLVVRVLISGSRGIGEIGEGVGQLLFLLRRKVGDGSEDAVNGRVLVLVLAELAAFKATNKAMAAAHKYALLQTFCIPTEDIGQDDPDAETPEPVQPKRDARPQVMNGPVDFNKVRAELARMATEEELQEYWKKVRVEETHRDYRQLSRLFLDRRKELAPKRETPPPEKPRPTSSIPNIIPADQVIAEFNACETVTALRATADRLAVPENHPDIGAIREAYRTRRKEIETGRTRAA